MAEAAKELSRTQLLAVARTDGAGETDSVCLPNLSGRRVLLLGGGDLVRKKQIWAQYLKAAGAEIFAADIVAKPTAIDAIGSYLSDFYCLEDRGAEEKVAELGKHEKLDLVDISTWGDSHLLLATRFQDKARVIVDTKPADTNLDLLETIDTYANKNSPMVRTLVNQVLVQDHYASRWIMLDAAQQMAKALADHGLVREIQIYILERQPVDDEAQRLFALRDGICLDLMPHAITILNTLLPVGASWETNHRTYSRKGLRLSLTGGARDQNRGCLIGGEVETFAAVSIDAEDVVFINSDFGREQRFPFKCLLVLGKGVAGHTGDHRDTKGVSITFQSGEKMGIDLESQRLLTPDGVIVSPEGPVLHRGINLPLIELAKCGFELPWESPHLRRHFQTLPQAYQGARLIHAARSLRWIGRAYKAGSECVSLVNAVPRDLWGSRPWQLDALPQIHFGTVAENILAVP